MICVEAILFLCLISGKATAIEWFSILVGASYDKSEPEWSIRSAFCNRC